MLTKNLAIFCLTLAFTLPALAAGDAMQATRLAPGEAIKLDGHLDEAVWQRAPEHSAFVEFEPQNGRVPSHRTSVRIAVDDKALYLAIVALDPQPDLIRAALSRHDTMSNEQDFVTVYLDPIGQKKSAQFFRVSASGATADGMQTDADNEDLAPDFDFDTVARRTPKGYVVEMRIPFSSLRYAAQGSLPWRIMVARRIPRDESLVLTSVPIPKESTSFISALQTLEGAGRPATDNFLQIRPTLTLRRTNDRDNGVSESANRTALGVDIKFRPHADWVIDGTFNPDFSQVELDVPQLARNRQFASSYAEKRPFFLESSDLLKSPGNDQAGTNSVYTRSITAPRWGLRATLRQEAQAGTLFTVQDQGGGQVLIPGAFGNDVADQPRSTASVAQMQWTWDAASLQTLLSDRSYGALGSNRVLGGGGAWQISDTQRLRAQWLWSSTSALADANGQLQRGTAVRGNEFFADWFRRTESSEASVSIKRSTDGFRNDNGFVPQTGIQSVSGNYNQIWRNTAGFNEIWLYLWGQHERALRNQQTVSAYLTPGFFLGGNNGLEFNLEWRGTATERVTANAPLLHPAYWRTELTYTPFDWMPRVKAVLDVGKQVDVDAVRLRSSTSGSLEARLRLANWLELEPRFEQLVLRSDAGGRAFSETLLRLLAVGHLSARDSIRLIAQTTSALRADDPQAGLVKSSDRTRVASLTYTHRRNAGTVFYAGASRQSEHDSTGTHRSTEVFLKLQLGI